MKPSFCSTMLVAACSSLLFVGCTPVKTQPSVYVAQDYVADGVFTAGIEGPAVGPDGHLYVVNFAKEGTIGRVVETADGRGVAELFVTLPEGSTGNGLRFDTKGNLYVADYTGHNVLKIAADDQQITVFAHNKNMHQPNDIARMENGIIFASDPNWSNNSGNVWRINQAGESSLVEANMGTTNGIAVSTDQTRLYVNESVQRHIWVYDLDRAGQPSNKRLFYTFSDFGMDGMRTDYQDRLYIARYGAGKVAVLSKEGKLLREIPLKGEKPTNITFGGKDGKTAYVTLQDRGGVETFRID